jgi:hypothetical protein
VNEEVKAERIVYCDDAILWLKNAPVTSESSLIASMPDISEFHATSLADWKKWFTDTAALVLSKTPDEGVSIFYQSDIKMDGTWVDKAFLCQQAAESLGHALLWHKIICRVEAGKATFGRPAYSHILCFSKKLRLHDLGKSTPDVIPVIGEKTWERGMGLEACLMIAKFLAEQTPTKTLIHPFCGQGSMIAMANHFGLNAIGIERSPKRAEMARCLTVKEDKTHKKFFENS